jgi:hypothetical protein
MAFNPGIIKIKENDVPGNMKVNLLNERFSEQKNYI